MRADDLLPDILADRDADLYAFELERLGHRTGREDALLVERTVIRQLALQRAAKHPTAIGENERVVVQPAFSDDRADQHCRPGLGRRVDEPVQRIRASGGRTPASAPDLRAGSRSAAARGTSAGPRLSPCGASRASPRHCPRGRQRAGSSGQRRCSSGRPCWRFSGQAGFGNLYARRCRSLKPSRRWG